MIADEESPHGRFGRTAFDQRWEVPHARGVLGTGVLLVSAVGDPSHLPPGKPPSAAALMGRVRRVVAGLTSALPSP